MGLLYICCNGEELLRQDEILLFYGILSIHVFSENHKHPSDNYHLICIYLFIVYARDDIYQYVLF
jgi:hypothetical protein